MNKKEKTYRSLIIIKKKKFTKRTLYNKGFRQKEACFCVECCVDVNHSEVF